MDISLGVLFVLIAVLVRELSWFLPMLFIKAAMVVYLLSYGSAKKSLGFPRNVALFILFIGILEVVAFLSYGVGITSEYTSIVAPIGAAFPVVTIVLARIFLKEVLEINQKIGVLFVLAGLVLLSVS